MRMHPAVGEPGTTLSEALQSASGGLVFLLGVATMGALVGLIGWTAARYTTLAVLVGLTMLVAIAVSAVWGLLRWAAVEPEATRPGARHKQMRQPDRGFRQAA